MQGCYEGHVRWTLGLCRSVSLAHVALLRFLMFTEGCYCIGHVELKVRQSMQLVPMTVRLPIPQVLADTGESHSQGSLNGVRRSVSLRQDRSSFRCGLLLERHA